MKINSQEVREGTSLHREQQTDGTCCHRNVEEDHASRCKKGSTLSWTAKSLNPERRSQLTECTDTQKLPKLPNGVRRIPASSSEPQDLLCQAAPSAPTGRAWSPSTQRGQRCLSKHKAERAEIKATCERSLQHCWG